MSSFIPPDRLALRGSEALVHYILPILFGAITLVVSYLTWSGALSISSWVIPVLGAMTLAVTAWRYRLLKFVEGPNSLTREEACVRLREAAGSAGWREERSSGDHVLVFATRPTEDPPHNNGERVTVLVEDRMVYINCINDPANWVEVFSGSEISENVEWLALALERGVWKFDPLRKSTLDSRAEEDVESLSAPGATGEKYHDMLVKLWSQDRAEVRAGMWKEAAIAFFSLLGISFSEIGVDLLRYEFEVLEMIAIIGTFSLSFAILVFVLALIGRKYFGVRLRNSDTLDFDSLVTSLQRTDWKIRIADPDQGIVADIPYISLVKGAVAAFHFRGDILYFNVYNDRDNADPLSASIVQRIVVLDWILRWSRGEVMPGIRISGIPLLRAIRMFLRLAFRRRVIDPENFELFFTTTGSPHSSGLSVLRPAEYYLNEICGDPKRPRIQLTGIRWLAYYLPSTSAIVAVLSVFLFGFSLILKTSPDVVSFRRTAEFIMTFALPVASVEVLLRHRRRRMKRLSTGRSASENYGQIRSKFDAWEWIVMKEIPGFYCEVFVEGMCRRHEMVSLVFIGNDVLVNSINTPETWHNLSVEITARSFGNQRTTFFGSTYSYLRNRRNVQRVEDALMIDPGTTPRHDPAVTPEM